MKGIIVLEEDIPGNYSTDWYDAFVACEHEVVPVYARYCYASNEKIKEYDAMILGIIEKQKADGREPFEFVFVIFLLEFQIPREDLMKVQA